MKMKDRHQKVQIEMTFEEAEAIALVIHLLKDGHKLLDIDDKAEANLLMELYDLLDQYLNT